MHKFLAGLQHRTLNKHCMLVLILRFTEEKLRRKANPLNERFV